MYSTLFHLIILNISGTFYGTVPERIHLYVRTDDMLTADSSSNELLVLLSHTSSKQMYLCTYLRMHVNGGGKKQERRMDTLGRTDGA